MKRFITAWLLTASMLTSAFFMPFLMKKWVEYSGITNESMVGFYILILIVYFGYLYLCAAAWLRAFNQTDNWF